jgi:putative ABC transport system substrate-binding protein
VAALAVKAATRTIPIVFGVDQDPVKLGLVASLARPGGNATGMFFFTAEVVAKRLGLLHDLLPAAERVAVLINPSNATTASSWLRDVEAAARALGLKIDIFNASTSLEIDMVFTALTREHPDAIFFAADAFFTDRRVQLANLAARNALPTSFAIRENVEAGGLMSYGANLADLYHHVGVYSGRILKGARTCPLSSRPSSSWSSTTQRPGCLASQFRLRCSRSPTRSSNDL